ncbi:hypothetical protein [Archaeoglobus fulgidus]|uniref:hypothetical protein n=1 Tax=Archaeoglobus fulgidus TaxID=2234 RepID=UPI0012DC7371|nr:hypothetical protein [Archaeoglobus fulgidus]
MKEKELYLHIGMHKTGTSAIQKFLWTHGKVLKNLGVLYPEKFVSPPDFAHHRLPFGLRSSWREKVLKDFGELLKFYSFHKKFYKMILSSEEFSVSF